MSRLLPLIAVLACAVGCESNTTVVPPASSPPARTEPEKTDVKVRTPRIDIDVDNKGDKRDVDIDVKRRPSNR
jgi:hypothetical protein